MVEATVIRIHKDVKKELEKLGKFGDTHNDIIKRLLEKCK